MGSAYMKFKVIIS